MLRVGGQAGIHLLRQCECLADDDERRHVAGMARGDLIFGDEPRRVAEPGQGNQGVVGGVSKTHDDVLAAILRLRPEDADAMIAPRLDGQGGEAVEEVAAGHEVGPVRLALHRIPVAAVHAAENVAEGFMSEAVAADAEGQPVGGHAGEFAGKIGAMVRRAKGVADPGRLIAPLHLEQGIHQQPLIQVVGAAHLVVPGALILKVERRIGRREILAHAHGGMIRLHAARVLERRIHAPQVLPDRPVDLVVEAHQIAGPGVEPFFKRGQLGIGHRLRMPGDLFDPELGG